jgi:transketolase
MRNAFSKALVQAAKLDNRIILLTGDHGYSLFDEFRHTCPEQYINAGVAEQNMVGVAAGLAKAGFLPVVYGLSAFVPIRVLEQIKLDICYEKLPVVLIGDGAGIVYSGLGSSHQSTEDIAALRALPHLSILSPADAYEMTRCMELALSAALPVYLRIGKSDVGIIHTSIPVIRWGELYPLRTGTGSLGFIATGSMVTTALKLAQEWENSSVWSAPSIKPLDIQGIVSICNHCQIIIVMEEHSVYGGLGSAIAEIAAENSPLWIKRIGIQDRFSKYCGTYQYLIEEHALDIDSIRKQIHLFITQAKQK